jgi:hypothetical protein
MSASPQIANLQSFIDNPQIVNQQISKNTPHFHLKKVLKYM